MKIQETILSEIESDIHMTVRRRGYAYQILMWIENLNKDISENLDCSSFDEFDWAELFMMDPLLLGHRQVLHNSVAACDVSGVPLCLAENYVVCPTLAAISIAQVRA